MKVLNRTTLEFNWITHIGFCFFLWRCHSNAICSGSMHRILQLSRQNLTQIKPLRLGRTRTKGCEFLWLNRNRNSDSDCEMINITCQDCLQTFFWGYRTGSALSVFLSTPFNQVAKSVKNSVAFNTFSKFCACSKLIRYI